MDGTNLLWRDIGRSQVNPIRLRGNRDIGTGIDQEPCLRPGFPDRVHRFSRQNLQVAHAKILFSQLNEIHAVKCGLGDLPQ